MNIKVLVSCCSDYGLKEKTDEVIKEIGIDATVEKVKDMETIMAYGVMKAPAIVINEKVKSMGRVPSKDEIKKYIQDEMGV
ncbi:thioredoxin family protein [Dehalobacter restrictus]|uniref:thioredoxin family protein n=1 Tax=Dehalobacter restrictus TaxID=55583 RepID=UPI00338EEF96